LYDTLTQWVDKHYRDRLAKATWLTRNCCLNAGRHWMN
jgi:succinylarginine dihydrolase